MALHPHLPHSPYEPLLPEQRWFPVDESLRASVDIFGNDTMTLVPMNVG